MYSTMSGKFCNVNGAGRQPVPLHWLCVDPSRCTHAQRLLRGEGRAQRSINSRLSQPARRQRECLRHGAVSHAAIVHIETFAKIAAAQRVIREQN